MQSNQPTTIEQSKEVNEEEITTTDTPLRYLAYFARIRTLLAASTRYLAYSSDIGEAFRPIVNPKYKYSFFLHL
jgi:fission process protein 1